MTIPQAFQIAIQHHQAGRLAEAEALYRQILALQPGHADAMHFLGVIAHQAGRHEAAVEWIRQSLALEPNNPMAHSHLGEALRTLGQTEAAITHFRRALQINPGFAEAWYNLGNAWQNQGGLDESMAAYRRALELKPAYPEALNNLGNALKQKGQYDDAIAAYRSALRVNPNLPQVHANLGNILRDHGRTGEAITAYHQAIQLHPRYPEAFNYLGDALRSRRQWDDAIAACRRALELRPDFPEALITLGAALAAQGSMDEAITSFRHALQLNPDDAGTHSNLVSTLHFHPAYTAAMIAEEHRRWNRQFGDPLKRSILPHANDRSPGRPLRIGYVSPDLRSHVVGRNLLPLFECHDRKNFEIVCYSGVVRPDEVTAQFRRAARLWRSTVGVPDEALARLIRDDGVDILVDLSQHMAGNRLPMFARQPAPIQVSFAGYPGSTGLETIAYRISDRFLEEDSANQDAGRRERVCLIDSFWCYHTAGFDVAVNPLPASAAGNVTFGCFNNFSKINEAVLSLWARVLGTVPHSRLILAASAGKHRERAVESLERKGVAAQRVEFMEFRPHRDYLESYQRLDIVLDTFPYNGHTTSLDALWMGVPVVSLVGKTPVSRAGLSQLTNLGLPELIARSETEYVSIAQGLAGDLPRLAELRSTLRARLETSLLMDAPRFARSIEGAFRAMWHSWRRA